MANKAQKLYEINFLAAFIVSMILIIYSVLYDLSAIQGVNQVGYIHILVGLACFLPLNLFIWAQNSDYKVKLPKYSSEKFFRVLHIVLFTILIVLFIFAFIVFPRAPIKASGNSYIDKNGNSNYNYAQFVSYKKWEVTFISTWSIFILQFIVRLPFYDGKSKTWRYGHKQLYKKH